MGGLLTLFRPLDAQENAPKLRFRDSRNYGSELRPTCKVSSGADLTDGRKCAKLHPYAMRMNSDRTARRERRFLPLTGGARKSRIGDFYASESEPPSTRVNSNPIKPNQTFRLVPQMRQRPPGKGICGKKKPTNGRTRVATAVVRNPTHSNLIQPNPSGARSRRSSMRGKIPPTDRASNRLTRLASQHPP